MIKKLILLSAFAVLLILTLAKCDEQPPVWANQFEQEFSETFSYPLVGTGKTTGKFFYDFTNKQYRVDRYNGKWDRYCGSVFKFKDTPCTHYVSQGKRYLDFPKENYCCYCCDSAHGCGVLRPDWLSGATYKGLQSENGQSYHVWDKPGLQSNLYWATADKKILSKIDQKPNDLQEFDVNTYRESISDPSVFNLPSNCNANKTCPWVSICTPLRFLQ
jgi:hypothetical protein